MGWLVDQAHNASPFIATFCLLVAWLVWRQLLFERKEHRTAERGFTAAALKMAKSIERLAVKIDMGINDGPRRRKR